MAFELENTFKYVAYGMGVLLVPFGITAIIFGIMILSGSTCLLLSFKSIVACGYLLILGGVALLISIIIVYWGIIKESAGIIRAVNAPEIITIALILAFSILLCQSTKPVDIKEHLEITIDKYLSSSEDKEFWDNLQGNYKCCGIDGFGDWDSKGMSVPESCCQKNPSAEAQDENEFCKSIWNDRIYVYKNGCYKQLSEAQDRFYYNSLYVDIAFVICYIIFLFAAYYILCAILGKWVCF